MSQQAPKVLCVVPNWIGDAVLALPALQLLADTGAALHFAGKSSIQRILQEVRGDTHWLELPQKRRSRLRCAWDLRDSCFDGVLLLTPSFSSALFAWCTGARWRLGEARDARSLLLTHRVGRIDRSQHLALSFQELAQRAVQLLQLPEPAQPANEAAAGLPAGLRQAPRIRVRDTELAALIAFPPEARSAIVIAPGAQYGPAKQYPPERFAAAAAALAQDTEQAIVLLGAEDDKATAAAVQRFLPRAINLTGSTNFGQLLAILSQARVVLANDSGIMHLAAALGTAVVGVFGSTNPAWTAPLAGKTLLACWNNRPKHLPAKLGGCWRKPPYE